MSAEPQNATKSYEEHKSAYQYQPLPDGAIRLLEIKVNGAAICDPTTGKTVANDAIECLLFPCLLEEAPKYDALSYTWQNPIAVYSDEQQSQEADAYFERKATAICNGSPLEINYNLYHALHSLRHVRRVHDHLHNAADHDLTSFSRYIWIDAICINQHDIPERNMQILLMHKVYKKAETVFIWLGPDDEFFKGGVDVLEKLHQPELIDQAESFRTQRGLIMRDYADLGLPSITHDQWLCVYAVMQRFWFRRSWIVQEVALAKRALVVCGLIICSWEAFVRAAMFLDRSQLYPAIQQLAEAEIKEKPLDISGKMTAANIMFAPPEVLLKQSSVHSSPALFEIRPLDDIFMPPRAIWQIQNIRSGLGIYGEGFVEPGPVLGMDFLSLIIRLRLTDCKDARDKIYATLGILAEKYGLDANSLPITVNYGKSVATVYTEAAWAIIRSNKTLELFSYAWSGSQISDLPSWVPDWTSSRCNRLNDTPSPGRTSSAPWHACGELLWDEQPLSALSKLTVRGIHVGNCMQAVKYLQHDLSSMRRVFTRLPNCYILPVAHSSHESTSNEATILGPQSADQLPLCQVLVEIAVDQDQRRIPAAVLCVGYHSKRYLELPDHSDSDVDIALQNMSISSAQEAQSAKMEAKATNGFVIQTRFEVLWRTLIHDQWQRTHPAPNTAGEAYVSSLKSYIVSAFLRTATDGINSATSGPYNDAKSEQDMYLTMLNFFSVLEKLDQQAGDLVQAYRIMNSRSQTAESEREPEPAQSSEGTKPENNAQRSAHLPKVYLPSISNATHFVMDALRDRDSESRQTDQWASQYTQVHHDILFHTEEGLLGTAAVGTQPGDQLWLIAGCPFPVLLRPRENGHFQLVSEAYVHGLMYGEVDISLPHVSLREIVLE